MSMITVFLIVLVFVFATLVFFLEPSEADKRIQQRLSGLDHRLLEEGEQTEIVRRVSFSRIAWIDRFLRGSKAALRLHLLLEQAKVRWTVGRFFFYSACLMLVGCPHWPLVDTRRLCGMDSRLGLGLRSVRLGAVSAFRSLPPLQFAAS